MSLFPLLRESSAATKAVELPLYREVAWDFDKDEPLFRNGRAVIVEGLEAVKVWAFNALLAQRYRYEVYTSDYGSEHETLVGQPYTEALKESEAARYIREALLIMPYITDVREITTDFTDGFLRISCNMITVYGEVRVNV